MGRHACADRSGGRTARGAELAKKALSIRPRPADARPGKGNLEQGRQGAARTSAAGMVDWPATLLQGRPRQRDDLRWQQRRSAAQQLWLVVVDASASTRRHGALAEAKGVLAQLFDDAYRQRARLALLTARGSGPAWQCHGLKASAALQPWLAELGAGGGTPLLAALDQAREWLVQRVRQHPQEAQRCLVFTDGRLKSLEGVVPLACPALLVDMEKGPIRLRRARALASALNAEYQHLDDLPRL
ncbi:VWA domain-containing protein [Pseudomonas sp. CFBP 8770]|uniref:VWA domain-containing protein n=1 Tax=unclassified Pseudomonas TaxID=196821 RepID=UPI00178225AD|nr:VWA domain-containing protein [Pseudomonas sp. CFBP 8773]MBD8649336.1 VWA domain-containing protein [Pseudomonas sp. CFBP 8770]